MVWAIVAYLGLWLRFGPPTQAPIVSLSGSVAVTCTANRFQLPQTQIHIPIFTSDIFKCKRKLQTKLLNKVRSIMHQLGKMKQMGKCVYNAPGLASNDHTVKTHRVLTRFFPYSFFHFFPVSTIFLPWFLFFRQVKLINPFDCCWSLNLA